MDVEFSKNYQVKPLTKIFQKTGKVYFRRDEVKAQILETLNFSDDDLTEKFNSFKSETLVFLLRDRFQNSFDVSGKIWEILSERILKIAKGQRSKFNSEADFEDFFSEIQCEMFERIGNFERNVADYAQVSFGEFVKGIILNKLRQKTNLWIREKDMIWLDAETENQEKPAFELIAKMTDAEKKLILRQAFGKVPREKLEVCILYYLEGLQIYSQDSHKTTIAKIYGKSEKTIRNWIAEVERILSEYRGELR